MCAVVVVSAVTVIIAVVIVTAITVATISLVAFAIIVIRVAFLGLFFGLRFLLFVFLFPSHHRQLCHWHYHWLEKRRFYACYSWDHTSQSFRTSKTLTLI